MRGKLARALVVTLTVIVAVIVVLSQANVTLPPQVSRLLTPRRRRRQGQDNSPLERLSQFPFRWSLAWAFRG
jgi:hypothetical protein